MGGVRVIKNSSVVVEDNFFGNDDDACVFAESEDGTSDKSVVSLIDTGDKGQPDGSVLELYYEELSRLQANPLGLETYSRKEKVNIELLDILKDMNAPLNAFSQILTWAAKSNESGYIFKADCQPTRQKVNKPFAEPPTASDIGDINTGRCYRATLKALIKMKGVDMLLPSISHGLMKHSVRSQPIAMRILGYINHSTPAHERIPSAKEADFNAPAHLPDGTQYFDDALKPHRNLSWAAYMLNETHIQIRYILEESGFLDFQKNGFKWKLNYGRKVYDVVLYPYVSFIDGDTEGHDRLCGHYTARFAKISKQLCRACECPTYMSGYSKANYPKQKPHHIRKLVGEKDVKSLQLQSQNYLKNGFDGV